MLLKWQLRFVNFESGFLALDLFTEAVALSFTMCFTKLLYRYTLSTVRCIIPILSRNYGFFSFQASLQDSGGTH